MKKYKIISVVLIICTIFSACSATALNDAISDVVTSEYEDTSVSTVGKIIEDESETESENKSEVESETESESTVSSESENVKGVGQSFDAAINYESNEGEKVTIGETGLRYTLNSFEIFDNFYDANLELNSSILEPDGTLSEDKANVIENNMFILVEMTATYNAPEGGKEEVYVNLQNDINAKYKDEKMHEGWKEEYSAIRKEKIWLYCPNLGWTDIPAIVPKHYDYEKLQNYCFYLQDGESRTFRIGIFCWEKFIENENVYLQINGFNPSLIEGYDGRYFAFFPEE